VDCARAALLLPLGISILHCQPVQKCSLVETAFLLLVTVATVNMLTTVLNDSPVFPEDDDSDSLSDVPLLMDSPQCVLFGTFMIWFASITINLGPTFLSGKLDKQSPNRRFIILTCRCFSGSGRGRTQSPFLSLDTRTLKTLHIERPVDRGEFGVCVFNFVPLEEAAQGPDQGERGGREGGGFSHYSGERDRGRRSGRDQRKRGAGG
jgi:hypothetical protein